MDILFVNSGTSVFYKPETPHHPVLYRNNGDGTFTDVSANRPVSTPISSAKAWPLATTTETATKTSSSPATENVFSTTTTATALSPMSRRKAESPRPSGEQAALWFDYDNDGKLDLFVGEFADYSDLRRCGLASSYGGAGEGMPKEQNYYCNPKQFPPVPSHLYRGLGNGHFVDVSESTGIAATPGKIWTVVSTDINQDGYMDLFASNDTMPNFLWVNREGKKFEEIGLEAGVGYSADGLARSGMGVDAGDFDNDGLPDLLVTNLEEQNTSLYKNLGGEAFRDMFVQTGLATVTRMLSGWGLRLFDYDNDGWLDLVEVNSHPDDLIDLRHRGVTWKEHIVLLRNILGTKLQDVSEQAGPAFSKDYAARGVAVGDLNNDGYPDIVFTEIQGPPHILMNNATAGNNWLGLSSSLRQRIPRRAARLSGGVLQARRTPASKMLAEASCPVRIPDKFWESGNNKLTGLRCSGRLPATWWTGSKNRR